MKTESKTYKMINKSPRRIAGSLFLLFLGMVLTGCDSNVVTQPGDTVLGGLVGSLQGSVSEMVTISGQVIDAASGEAVGNASITVDGLPDAFSGKDGRYYLAPFLLSSVGGTSISSVTASSQKVTVTAGATGYDSAVRTITMVKGMTSNLEFRLSRKLPAELSGMVTNASTGLGIPGVTVTVASGGDSVSAKTSESVVPGTFSFSGLTTGFHYVSVTGDGFVSKVTGATLESGVNRIELSVSPVAQTTASFTGIVIDSRDGNPISGATVQVGGNSSVSGSGANGSIQGLFTLDSLPTGFVHVAVSSDGFRTAIFGVTLEKGSNVRNLTLSPETTNNTVRGNLIGTAVDSRTGRLKAGVVVTVGASSYSSQEYRGTTGTDGWYSIEGIPVGTHPLTAVFPDTSATSPADIITSVTITEGINVLNLSFTALEEQKN